MIFGEYSDIVEDFQSPDFCTLGVGRYVNYIAYTAILRKVVA